MKREFSSIGRPLGLAVALLLLAFVTVAPGAAQDQMSIFDDESGWQVVITDQINAFRAGDAATALELAASGFKRVNTDPERFVRSILTMGYGPILNSRSHSFGEYRPDGEGVVLQLVQVIGDDQGYYEAWYRLGYETDGWRVLAVALSPKQGVGI